MNSQETFECYAIVELMGHNAIAGYVTEQSIAGTAMLRVDVPAVNGQPAYSKFFSGSAVYGITPTDEAHATIAAARLNVRPVTLWIVPEHGRSAIVPERPALPGRVADDDDDYDDYDDNDEPGF